MRQDRALIERPRGALTVSAAVIAVPGAHQIAIRAHAVAMNPVDRYMPPLARFIAPWLTFPAVIGTEVAGKVEAIGANVSRFRMIFVDVLPAALSEGRYVAAPPALVSGDGPAAIPAALAAQASVSARRVVVRLGVSA